MAAQMRFPAQATYWSAVDLHKAVMTNKCEALNRPIRKMHPEVASALAAKTDLFLSGVAFDEHARVTIESEASKLYEASPWAADKRAAELVRLAPVQTADRVPPTSPARDMAFAELQSRILSAAEAVQAAKLHSEMLPEQQDVMLTQCRDLALAPAGQSSCVCACVICCPLKSTRAVMARTPCSRAQH